jgi:uncharacterized protein YndB with AHSA1/START domain
MNTPSLRRIATRVKNAAAVCEKGYVTMRVSRIIKAPRRTIYQAFLDPLAWAAWLAPNGMKGQVYEFDPQPGGAYRMSLTYQQPGHATSGKTSEHSDVVQGQFLELIPDERVVQQVEFESDDPAFAGAMTIIWALDDVPGGTEVTILCENVPEGIQPGDHELGIKSTLENLAAFTE